MTEIEHIVYEIAQKAKNTNLGHEIILKPKDFPVLAKAIEKYFLKEVTEIQNNYSKILEATRKDHEVAVLKARIEEHKIDCDHCNLVEQACMLDNKCSRLAQLKKELGEE